MHRLLAIFGMALLLFSCKDATEVKEEITTPQSESYTEKYRLQYHFSPLAKWMNDPNGLVYADSTYHLYYQHYPDSTVWGPMHWGHAISKDMVNWEHKPIAIYPDSLGLIFSGSAVMDYNNTSGFGKDGIPPMVAIYTYHDMDKEKAGDLDFQTQGIAYSLDGGLSFEKYSGNPVISNNGIKDFRDPKVFWYEKGQEWIMTLVAGDHARFYSSDDLKSWAERGRFGEKHGAHGGVWECPDLFEMEVVGEDTTKWVLLISMNPGAPNGGSGTQYFIGNFDGSTFTADDDTIRWLDWGRDNYAGVTYNDTPDGSRLFIGWMSNWQYARDIPTEGWRSSMTLPRNLYLKRIQGELTLTQEPVESLNTLMGSETGTNLNLKSAEEYTDQVEHLNQALTEFRSEALIFDLVFSNDKDEALVLNIDREQNKIILDRRDAGDSSFSEYFGEPLQEMPLTALPEGEITYSIYLDASSIEVFVNNGQYVMTSRFFASSPLNLLTIKNKSGHDSHFEQLKINPVRSIWTELNR